ncbi:unnamed protein product [Brassica oleracea]|uniref:(rape) hypothetical protein n=1 Tax=Brassica napus TaxID=3708 RepID=A0A816J6N9_BRANA|nr:unnamed protein product [Brassica napus]
MFAAGEEPLGERVNSYHKLKRTELLIEALEPDELEFLRNSTFGKILAIEENPPFSGAFGQYVVVRLQKVNKKYEIPEPTKKRKTPLKEKLYWNELLGSLKFCTVDTAIDMLKKKVVKSKEARIKFACLAITSSILFPSSHTPRIIPEHVELIRDLDDFLAFPWGRASYHTLATSLISKDEIALSQASVAIRGYVDAIQLVLLVAIPQLKEEITQSERTVIVDSESESENPNEDLALEGDNAVPLAEPSEATKYCLIPGHAKSIDIESRLHSPPVNGNPPVVPDTSTPSEAADFRISEVLRDLNIVPDHSLPANTVDNLDAELDTANGSSLHTSIVADSQLQAEQRDVQVEDLVTANDITEHNNQSLGVSFFVVENPDSEEFEKEDMHIPFYLDDMPSFSLGLSQEDAPVVEEMPNSINYVSPPMAHEKEAPEPRKSKRSRIIPAGLQDYKCDPKVNAEHCIIPDVDHRFTLMEQKVMKES